MLLEHVISKVYAAKMMAFRSPTGTLVVKLKAETQQHLSVLWKSNRRSGFGIIKSQVHF